MWWIGHPNRPEIAMAHHAHDAAMDECIRLCLQCYRTCQATLSQHCLEVGGAHVEPVHFRLMLACAEVCRTSAHLMITGSHVHKLQCAACAQVCRECAKSCAALGDMQDCVAACETCADSCERMAA